MILDICKKTYDMASLKFQIAWHQDGPDADIYGCITITAPKVTIEEARSKRPPLTIIQVYDVSGSMLPNMSLLTNMSRAVIDLLDDGSRVSAIAFDHEAIRVLPVTTLDGSNRGALKERLVSALYNRRSITNIVDAMLMALDDVQATTTADALAHPCAILLMTDGVANMGFVTDSDDIFRECSTHRKFDLVTVHCIGLQTTSECSINARLLKNLAADSGGAFHLLRDASHVPEAVGDLLAQHYMASHVGISVTGCTTVDPPEFIKVVTKQPVGGLLCRSDEPLQVVVQVPGGARGRPVSVCIAGVDCDSNVPFALKFESTAEAMTADATTQAEILKARVAGVVDAAHAGAAGHKPSLEALRRLVVAHIGAYGSALRGLMTIIDDALARPAYEDANQMVSLSALMGNRSSLGAVPFGDRCVSAEVTQLRSESMEATQAYEPQLPCPS